MFDAWKSENYRHTCKMIPYSQTRINKKNDSKEIKEEHENEVERGGVLVTSA